MPYADPEVQREYRRLRAAKVRAEYLDGKCCARCGSTENLQIDHIDPKTKVSHRIWTWAPARRTAELTKCQVLCETHHKEKTRIYKLSQRKHGTITMYKEGKCRCERCRAANALAKRIDRM